MEHVGDGSPPLKIKRTNLSTKAGSSKDCNNREKTKATVGKELSEKVATAKRVRALNRFIHF